MLVKNWQCIHTTTDRWRCTRCVTVDAIPRSVGIDPDNNLIDRSPKGDVKTFRARVVFAL
jgi:hypothetical protein